MVKVPMEESLPAVKAIVISSSPSSISTSNSNKSLMATHTTTATAVDEEMNALEECELINKTEVEIIAQTSVLLAATSDNESDVAANKQMIIDTEGQQLDKKYGHGDGVDIIAEEHSTDIESESTEETIKSNNDDNVKDGACTDCLDHYEEQVITEADAGVVVTSIEEDSQSNANKSITTAVMTAVCVPPTMMASNATAIAVVQPTARQQQPQYTATANVGTYAKASVMPSNGTKHQQTGGGHVVNQTMYVTLPQQPQPQSQPPQPPSNQQQQPQKQQRHPRHQQAPHRILAQIPSIGVQPISMHHCQTAVASTACQNGSQSIPVATAWPIVDPVFHFGAGFEPPARPYCPKHEPQPQEHIVMFHVHPGVSVTFQIAGNQEIIRGPVTVPMVSQSGSPPIPMPVQVPPGHLMQQIVDENGTLRHVILSTAQTHQIHSQGGGVQHHIHGHYLPTNGTTSQFYSQIPTGYPGVPPGGGHYHHLQPPIPAGHPQSQQHSPSPPSATMSSSTSASVNSSGNNSNNNGGGGPVYHNKDERQQQIHKKLQKKLEKRELINNGPSTLSTPTHSPSPRKINNIGDHSLVTATIIGNSGGVATAVTTTNHLNINNHSASNNNNNNSSSNNNNNSGGKRNNSHKQQQQQQSQLIVNNYQGNMNYHQAAVVHQHHLQQQQQQQQQHHQHTQHLIQGLPPQQQLQHHNHHNIHHQQPHHNNNSNNGSHHNHHHNHNNHHHPPPSNNQYQMKMVAQQNAGQGPPSRGRVIATSNVTATMVVPRKTMLKKRHPTHMNGNSTTTTTSTTGITATNGGSSGCGSSSVGTSEDGEEATSSVEPEDEDEYQAEDLDELDGEMESIHELDECQQVQQDEVNNNNNSNHHHHPLEDELQHIKDQLSTVAGPKVSEVQSRSALLQWQSPLNTETIQFNHQDLLYEILLSDSAKYGNYKSIFKGQSMSCRIQDLKPGVEYSVCLRVHYQGIQGLESPTTMFNTIPCAPDTPLPPKLLSRTKNSFQLRWNATADNGSHIQQFVLESDNGRNGDFVEMIRTKGKQYTLTKLTPSTRYRFRLYAVNEYGKSGYSEVECFETAGLPPSQPLQPSLAYATSSSLRLEWISRNTDKEFVLQMAALNDNVHGFLPCYTGNETSYEYTNLPRATPFLFRLRATNEFGVSQWSPEVYYFTEPEEPRRPPKPQVKGKIHSSHFKIKWEPPTDTGGAPIIQYYLQISSGDTYEQVYMGPHTETVCDRLSPATTYQVRVSCEGVGGRSVFSEPCTVTTEPVTASAPTMLQIRDLGVYSANIRWSPPDDNGGAPILEYELDLKGVLMSRVPATAGQLVSSQNATTTNNTNSACKSFVYHVKEPSCDLKQLLPGERYTVQVRAYNRIGAGAWSDVFEFNANATAPNSPKAPELTIHSSNHVLAQWQEPPTNGSAITEYVLEMSASSDQSSPDAFQVAYRGLALSHDMAALLPYSKYYFKLCAINGAGTSNYSDIVEIFTPAGPPAAPIIHEMQKTSQEVILFWREPANHGSAVLSYTVEYSMTAKGSASPLATKKLQLTDLQQSEGENTYEYVLENLQPETSYRIKMRAVNAIGSSPLSAAYKVTTLPCPPVPPQLECIGVAHNSLKLRWGEGKNVNFLYYYVDMSHSRSREYALVYSGSNFTCKVTKLNELTTYKFRIRAKSDRAGLGDNSQDYYFRTSAAQPQSIKAPRIYYPQDVAATNESDAAEVIDNDHNNINVEWQHSKNAFQDPIEYILQIKRADSQEYQQIYRGPETRFLIENLDCCIEYTMRVCPIRLMSTTTTTSSSSSSTSSLRRALRSASKGSSNSNLMHDNDSNGTQERRASGASRSSSQGGNVSCDGDHDGGQQKQQQQQHQDHESNCDISELMGQWSPVLNYVMQQQSCADHADHHNHHIHHPHTHHTHHHHRGSGAAGNGGHHQHQHHHHHHGGGGSAQLMALSSNGQSTTTDKVDNGKGGNELAHAGGRGVIGMLRSLYSSRQNLTDAEKALICAVIFMLVTLAVAIGFAMFMGK